MGYNDDRADYFLVNEETIMSAKKKNILDKIVDAVTDRDEKEAAEKAAAEKAATEKAAALKAAEDKAIADRAAALKAAADRAAATKAAADKAAALKAAEAKAVADRAAALKAAAEKGEEAAAAAPKKGVVQVRSLHIRKDHTTASQGVGGLVRGDEVTILDTWTDGKDTWVKIGPDQWAAMLYDGETYIKLQ